MTRRPLPFVIALLALILPLAASPCQAASTVDDFQAWFGLNTILWTQNQGKWSLGFWTEARFQNDASEPLGYFVGPGARFRAHRNLDLELAALFILFRAEPEDLQLVRYQLAVNPHFRLFANTRLRIRNRAEIYTSRGEYLRTRMRHRFRLGWQIHDMGPLVGAYVSEELFYNWGEWDIVQSRFVPLGLVWRTGAHMRVSTYYMMQYIHPISANVHALGVTAIWTLAP